MTDIFNETLSALESEKTASSKSDELYKSAKEMFTKIEAAYMDIRGGVGADGLGKITNLIRKYGPTAMKYLGGPAGGAAITAMMADQGSFSGIKDVFGKVLGLFG